MTQIDIPGISGIHPFDEVLKEWEVITSIAANVPILLRKQKKSHFQKKEYGFAHSIIRTYTH